MSKTLRILFIMMSVLVTSIHAQKKPNILFIISDDLTATAVSSYENKACFTPNIDKLASEGVMYTSAFCQFPVCGPSRASLMFSYYPHATGTFGYISGRENVGDRKAGANFLWIMGTNQCG